MAEIQATITHKKRFTASKKLSTRVDLTPMVDLGFLLITFFIFTTTLSQPKTMNLSMPVDGPETGTVEGKTLTLLLYKNNTIGYYAGTAISDLRFTNYSAAGIRTILQHHQKKVKSAYKGNHQEFIIIKPVEDATYANIVAVLDEMLINNIKGYVLNDATPEEVTLLSNK